MAHSLLEGKTALVTGAAQGLGRAIAMLFADEGARVALFDRSKRVLETCAELSGDGHKPFVADVTHYDMLRTTLDALWNEWGRFDVLVNNAGIFFGGTVLTSTLDEWQKVMGVNVEAMFMFSKFVAARMVEQKSGRIVNVASVAGFASRGNVGAYNASKGGVMALTKSMAVELAPYGIVVNAVAPGMMRTAMLTTEQGQDLAETKDFKRTYLDGKRIPMRRVGEPEEIASTVVFLASDYCRYMTGQTLIVDGGMTSTF